MRGTISPMVGVAVVSLFAALSPVSTADRSSPPPQEASPDQAGRGVTAGSEGPAGAEGPRRHSFAFTRAIYPGGMSFWSRRGAWTIDYPKADRQFLVVLRRVTNLDAYPDAHAIRLDDPELRRYPFLYAVEVGHMRLSEVEAEALRNYLEAGGFLVVDDFWGSREWAAFERNMRMVFPDREIVEIPPDHILFRSFYEIDEIRQVPSVRNARGGRTWERDGYEPRVRGIFDDDGRLMVAINWNTDLGDAWEWADIPEYPLEYSTFAYQMGVNLIVYGLSH